MCAWRFTPNDRLVGLDEPRQGALCEFLRDADGKVSLMRIGGRLHPKVG
jgi:hypothetical protein